MNRITEILWYDSKSDSTLHRYDWRFHHNGIALLILFVLTFTGISALYSAIIIHSVFMVYKLFIQGNFKNKTAKDFQDFIADFTDYGVIWLMVFPDKLTTGIIFMILLVSYYLTSKWSTP